jgi:hypothetical protein
MGFIPSFRWTWPLHLETAWFGFFKNISVYVGNICLKKNSVPLVRKRTVPPSDHRLPAKLVPTFAYRWCRVVSATDPHSR